MQTILEELHAKGFALVPYDYALRDLVIRAVRSWETFCTLPVEEKNRYMALGGNDGYQRTVDAESFILSKYTQVTQFDPAETPSFINDCFLILEDIQSIARGIFAEKATVSLQLIHDGTIQVPGEAYLLPLFPTDEIAVAPGKLRVTTSAEPYGLKDTRQFALTGIVLVK